MNIRVIDEHGAPLAQGRELAALQQRFLEQVRTRVAEGAASAQEQQGLTDFPDQGLPTETALGGGANALAGYPALIDRGDTVDLRICATRTEQGEANRTGYPRLAWLALGKPRRFFERQVLKEPVLVRHAAVFVDTGQLVDSVMLAAAWRCYFEDRPLPATKAAFDALLKTERPRLAGIFTETITHLGDILQARTQLVARLESSASPAFRTARDDVESQMNALTPPDLLQRTPSARLPDLARFLRAADHRLANLQGHAQRDAERMAQIKAFEGRLMQLHESERHAKDKWRELPFDLEELRVALFAEALAKKGVISVKKMDQRLLEAEREAGLR